MLQERASGCSQPRSLSQGRLAPGGLRARRSPSHHSRSSRGEEEAPMDLGRVKAPPRAGWGPRGGTSAGEVPQLFPANCFTYVLEKDMALSFRNHSSAQWVQQGANTCETPTEAAPSPFLKHFFCCYFCLHSGKPTAGLFDPIFSLHHTHIKHYNSV